MSWIPLVILVLVSSPWPGPPPWMEASLLAEAEDDQDIPDEAFHLLIDHVRTWPEGARTPGPRLEVAREDLLRDPAAHRGLLLVIEGRIEQHRDLAPPFEDVQEWFVRDLAGDPWIVYVVGEHDGTTRDGQGVILEAHFYKRMLLDDRSGIQRTYPALAGAMPLAVPGEGTAPMAVEAARLWVLLAILAGVLLLVFLLARRASGRPTGRRAIVLSEDSLPPDPPLPGEADEALRELKRRGHDEST